MSRYRGKKHSHWGRLAIYTNWGTNSRRAVRSGMHCVHADGQGAHPILTQSVDPRGEQSVNTGGLPSALSGPQFSDPLVDIMWDGPA